MQRQLFDYHIKDREGIRLDRFMSQPPETVKAQRYGVGLIIHASFVNAHRGLKTDYYWTVAHEATGYAIVSDVPKRVARHVAAVLAELPIDWTASSQAEFIDRFKAMPQSLQQLVHTIRKADYGKAA